MRRWGNGSVGWRSWQKRCDEDYGDKFRRCLLKKHKKHFSLYYLV
ncbi:hypothetical protein CLOSTASPAR_04095 [[Clostridium] asparagiforme DSM 15981]|uniref:Uncharacterized protein n=1 Tax=[Clostridium] asparagiforme DSM 15981 TaxID=518636 RepID=C0D4A1_9FIRM|nr:hypothetical protein CLOSTASPAR_04095 [[Clostridium] asparagiforme DSM 15981]